MKSTLFARVAAALLGVVTAIGGVGCSDDGGLELFVDLKTDLVAAAEFDSVRVELVGEGAFDDASASRGDAFQEGRRVAEFGALPPNESRSVRVRLTRSGAPVAERVVALRQLESRSITIVVTRSCVDVMCGADESCHGGRCVAPECVTGAEPVCPEPECRTAAECTGADACAMGVCEDAVCLFVDADRCTPSEYCDPDVGCVLLDVDDGGPGDGGPDAGDGGADAGGIDAGGMDAGTMDAGAGDVVPRPFWPPNGHPTGSVHAPADADVLRPTLRWSPAIDAVEYEVEVSDDCGASDALDCAFPTVTERTRTSATSLRTMTLAVSMVVPVGRRYHWRVRACDAATCGAWSAVRWFDAGRLTYDVNGDGYDDIAVGARFAVTLHPGSPEKRFVTSTNFPNPGADDVSGYGEAIHFDDFSGDGFRDVVVGAYADGGVGSVFLHRGQASGLGIATRIPAPAGTAIEAEFGRRLCSGDMDGDGIADLAVAGARVSWWIPGGPTPSALPLGSFVVEGCADLDEDGYQDLFGGGDVLWGGPGGPETRPTVVPSNLSFAIGDLTGDGHVELVGRGDSNVPIYRTGSEIVPLGNLDVGMNCLEHQTGAILDIDGDGRNEALVSVPGASPDQGALYWIRFVGVDFVSAPFSVCTGDCQQGTALSVGLDRNGDGLGDVAVGAPGRTWITSVYGPAVGSPNLVNSMRSGLFTHYGLAL